MSINFDGIAAAALNQARSLLPQWFPAGRFHGDEFHIGNASGEAGDSLKFNVVKGAGMDFATGETFGDMIDLYAARFGLSVKDAAAELASTVGVEAVPERRVRAPTPRRVEMELPPVDADIHPETFASPNRGLPSAVYAYRNREGRLRSVVVRWDADESRGRRRKEFSPFIWAGDGWIPKAPPTPRPLYGIETLDMHPNVVPVIVEGEKAAAAARAAVFPGRPILTWPGGASAVNSADWSELADVPEVIIWPDADKPGVEAAADIAGILSGMGIRVSVIDVSDLIAEAARGVRPSGWDIADWVEAGTPRKAIQEWGKARRKEWAAPKEDTIDAPPPVAVIETDTESLRDVWGGMGLALRPNGVPFANMDNCARIISHQTAAEDLHYDPFLNQVRVREAQGLVKLRDDHILSWTLRLQREYGLADVRTAIVQDALYLVTRQRPVNSLQGWLRSLEWDGTARVESIMVAGFGAEDNEYHRAVGRCFLISLVARAMRPGCQVDTMPILEGLQGAGKSRGLEALAGPEFYADIDSPIGTTAHATDIQGKWLVEISELSGMRASEVERVKSGITRTVDVYREPWARVASDHPRQCVYAGTTNAHQYLLDDTGNRRFWPVAVGKIDREWIKTHRAQLFAEALRLFDAGRPWWDVPADQAAAVTGARVQLDAINDTVASYLAGRPGEDVSIAGILAHLEIPPAQWNVPLQRRVGAALRFFGYRCKKTNGKSVWTPADVLTIEDGLAENVTPIRRRSVW